MNRARRRQRILELLRSGPIPTQDALRERLESEAIRVTQATLSRDLTDLGVTKTPSGYALPSELGGAASFGRSGLFRESVVGVVCAASIVIVKTAPGHANAVATTIDNTALPGAVGSLAGDDTIFIAAESDEAAARLRDELASVARLD